MRLSARPPQAASAVLLALWLLILPVSAGATERNGEILLHAMEYPWSAIGRVNAGGRAFCTGFLVSEDRVMTAAHCLYDFVQGRWRGASEMHFIAGYQRDQYILHSKVRDYVRAANFQPTQEATIDSVVTDWALLTLQKPIGREAGWLPVAVLDAALRKRLQAEGRSLYLAGYHAARPHAQSLRTGCRLEAVLRGGQVITHSCRSTKGLSGAPLLAFVEGRPLAMGIHSIEFKHEGEEKAGVLSLKIFSSAGAPRQARRAFRSGKVDWRHGRAPADGSPAGESPSRTIDLLLARQGHLPASATPPVAEALRRDAIASYRSATGIRGKSDGENRRSLELLGDLLKTLRE